MARKRSSVSNQTNAVTIDVDRQKYGRWAAILLFGLIAGIFFCLICGWISGDTSYNEISDNIVTALLQNYNYILASLVLIPVIAYIYSKIKAELKAKFISDDQIMLWGFLIGLFILVMIVSVCSIVYPINSSTYYGLNSANTVGIFLCFVITLIILSLVCLVLKCSSLLSEQKARTGISNSQKKEPKVFWSAVKKYLPIILMIMFLIWTFISCMLAPGAADDIIGAEAAEKADQGDGDEGDGFDSSGGDDDNNGYSPFGTGLKRSEIIDVKDTHALENELLKAVYNKTVLNTRQDPVYYYNRKKYNSNVMISRSREEQLWRPGNIILLVDCSGSIDDTAIGTMVKTVRRIAKKCGPKSRIIWWDTFLEGDYPLNADKGPKGYGGTNIAKGIKYVRQHYLRQSNDKLVIISDYADSLTQWYDEVRKIKNDVVGLCWLYSRDKTETAKQYLSNWWSYDNDGEENKSFDKLLKKIPTTLVNIASA